MFYRYNFFEDKGLLKVMVYGKADAQSMRSRLVLLANDHRWKCEYKLLIDYSSVTTIDRPQDFGKTLQGLLNELPQERLPVGIAYVFPERLFCQCFDPEQASHHIHAKCGVRFFRQEAAAVEWLEAIAEECTIDRETS
jgi:hypothetical protein